MRPEQSQLTLKEKFHRSLCYFIEFEKYFNKKQFDFLKSIQHYRLHNELTTKQMTAFISLVDSVMFNSHKYNQQELTENGNLEKIFEVILSFYSKDESAEDFYKKIIKYREQIV